MIRCLRTEFICEDIIRKVLLCYKTSRREDKKNKLLKGVSKAWSLLAYNIRNVCCACEEALVVYVRNGTCACGSVGVGSSDVTGR